MPGKFWLTEIRGLMTIFLSSAWPLAIASNLKSLHLAGAILGKEAHEPVEISPAHVIAVTGGKLVDRPAVREFNQQLIGRLHDPFVSPDALLRVSSVDL